MFSDFYAESLAALDKYHPNWDDYEHFFDENQEFVRSIIMCPPACDLLKNFVGPVTNNADGFFAENFKKKKSQIDGDQGECLFYKMMENVKIGGLLIYGFKIHYDLCSEMRHYFPAKNEAKDVSFKRHLKQDKPLFNRITTALSSVNLNTQELDFIFLHPIIGVVLIEVKNIENLLKRDADGLKWKMKNRKVFGQLQKNAQTIKEIVKIVYDSPEPSEEIVAKCIAFLAAEQIEPSEISNDNDDIQILCGGVADCEKKLDAYFRKMCAEQLKKKLQSGNRNLFIDNNFRKLISIFVGCRPDIFMSPVKCVLHWNSLIDAQLFHSILQKIPETKLGKKNKANEAASQIARQKMNARTSRDNQSVTAQEIMQTHFENMHADVRFVGSHSEQDRIIYFTEKQQEAIVDESAKVIIKGVPGSGKSLVQMMRIYIAMQDELRKNVPVLVVSSAQHVGDYKNFIEANEHCFIRRYVTQALAQNALVPAQFNREESFDLYGDEILSDQLLAFFSKKYAFQKFSLVLSSPRENQHDMIAQIEAVSASKVLDLETHFRGTKQITKLWQQFYFTDRNKPATVGHDFDGIAPELHPFEHIVDCFTRMHGRISRLIEIEGCKVQDFALLFATYAEMSAFAEYLQDKYEFRLQIVDNSPQITNDVIMAIVDDWKSEFDACFKSTAESDYSREAHRHDFVALSLIALEFRNLCDDEIRELIDAMYRSFMEELELLKDGRNRSPEWEFKDGSTTNRIIYAMADLRVFDEFTSPNFEPASFAYWKVYYLQTHLPIFISNAIRYCKRNEWQAEYYGIVKTFFQKNIEIVNTWPHLLHYNRIPSIQFPIIILFTRKLLKYVSDISASEQNFGNFLSLAISRAQSHVIVFEWNHPCEMDENDKAFSQGILKILSIDDQYQQYTGLDAEVRKFYSD